MKSLSSFLIASCLVSANVGHAAPIWDITQATACTYNPTLGGSLKCSPKTHTQDYSSPLDSFGKTLPPFFTYDLTLQFTFVCKREVGAPPLSADISIIDPKTRLELSRLRLAPTSSAEKRRLSFKIKADKVQTSIKINPSFTSTYYGPCYFELHDPELVPDFENLEWYADSLIDQRQFTLRIDEVLVNALGKPNGWERAEQLGADLSGYAEVKSSECKRSVRQLARKLRIEASSRTPEDQYLITELSGLEPSSLSMTAEDLNSPEDVCSNNSVLSFSGKIGSLITDIANLKDAEEKAKVFLSLEDCRSQVSEICRTKVQSFRSGVLNPLKSSLDVKEKSFLDYLDAESKRLKESQLELSEQIKGLFDEISHP
jgi:hypothetical protein